MEKRKSQAKLIFELLSDGEPHRTDEIVNKVYSGGSLARVGARIFDIQRKYGVKISGWHDSQNPKLYWYQLLPPEILLEEIPEYEMWNKGIQDTLFQK